MDGLPPESLPFNELLPVFLLGLFLYGLIEWAILHFRLKRSKSGEYFMSIKGLGANALIGSLFIFLIGPFSKTLLALWGAELSPFSAGLGFLGWVYGFVIYEMAYWTQHWLAHKVRILWCLHSPHHAPNSINMFVGFNHSFLETLFYFPFMLGFIPALLGVDPVIIIAFTFIDVVWGNLLHISSEVAIKRWGPLERFMQTPSYHRVHHAQNVRYMDTNYNSITLLGDWLMGTLHPLDDNEPVKFGITRDVNTSSFWDVHFGEFVLLGKDIRHAGSIANVTGYLLRPPGWSPQGEQQTASARKQREIAAGQLE